MSDNKYSKEDEERNDSKEIIERLAPPSSTDKETDAMFDLDNEKSITDKEIDHLFDDVPKLVDHSIDSLFEEGRSSTQKALQDEVQKALSQPVMSKASLYRMRMTEPSETALTGEIAKMKTVEEIWGESAADTDEPQNKKSIMAMCVIIAMFTMAGSWALWKSTNDERGNEEVIAAKEKRSIEKEKAKQIVDQEIRSVTELMHLYFSAITLDQKCEHIYQADSFKKEIKTYYEKEGGVIPISEYSIDHILPIKLHGEDLWEIHFENLNIPTEGLRSLYVRKNDEGEFKVDWESDIIFQRNSVEEFQDTRSKVSTDIKFVVDPRNKVAAYNWGFKDTEYRALRLRVPNSDMLFWGYVKKGSVEQHKIDNYLEIDLRQHVLEIPVSHNFILTVRFLDDSPEENYQYILIEDVVSRKWIMRDK